MPVIPIAGAVPPVSGLLSYLYQRSADHAHRGIDLPAPRGTPVRAAAGGVVEHASMVWMPGFTGYGRHVVIRHPGGVWTLYAHLDKVAVQPGQRVSAGEHIGAVGNTAFTAAGGYTNSDSRPHLHFEVSPRRYPQESEASRLDPVKWLAGDGGLGVAALVLGAGAAWVWWRRRRQLLLK